MRKKLIVLFLLATTLAIGQNSAPSSPTVHLKGQLKDMGSRKVILSYNGAASLLGDSRDVIIDTDDNGYFDIQIHLDRPEYYSISRNTLYLTPGDDMTVMITTNNTAAEFSGKGAEANIYMKKRLFPKGGSFLQAGENVRPSLAATKATIDSLAHIRLNELQALDGVSEAFKALEKARIDADIINSYFCYPSYSNLLHGIKDRETVYKKIADFIHTVGPELNERCKQISADQLLDVAVVRDVLQYASEPSYAPCFEGIVFSDRTKELFEAAGKSAKLRQEINKKTVDEVILFSKGLKNRDFANELDQKVAQLGKLISGNPAPDLLFQTTSGEMKRLSDFKGKSIYIDFWATWCGPCIQESPHFETLSKKYEGKDIVFLPISTDANPKTWLSFLKGYQKSLTQYCSQDEALKKEWAIFYIPRFILIDKDFNIVDAYAPRPSSAEISELIDKTLKQ